MWRQFKSESNLVAGMTAPRKNIFRRCIEQLNFTKLSRDMVVAAASKGGLVATAVTFSQLVPPEITTFSEFNDWLAENPYGALQRMWRRRKRVQKKLVATKSAVAAMRGSTEKLFENVLKALLSVYFGTNVESLLGEKYDWGLRCSLDLAMHLKTRLFALDVQFTPKYAVAQDATTPLYKTIPDRRLATIFRNTEKSFVDNLFINISAFTVDRIIDTLYLVRGNITPNEFFQKVFTSVIEKTAATIGAVITNALVSIFIRGDHWISWGVILVAETIGSDYAANAATNFVTKYLQPRPKRSEKESYGDDLEQDGVKSTEQSEAV